MAFQSSRYLEIGTAVALEMHKKNVSAYDVAKKSRLRVERIMDMVRGYSEPKIGEARVFEIMLEKPAFELFPQWIKKREAKLK